jgi:hypothetical protein
MNNEEKFNKLNEAHERIEKEKYEGLTFDFDKALEESKAENIKIKLFNKVFELPPKIPFSFSMFLFRYCFKIKNGRKNLVVPDDKISEFITKMFGKTFLRELEKSDTITTEFIMQNVSISILNHWGMDMKKSIDTSKKKMK